MDPTGVLMLGTLKSVPATEREERLVDACEDVGSQEDSTFCEDSREGEACFFTEGESIRGLSPSRIGIPVPELTVCGYHARAIIRRGPDRKALPKSVPTRLPG